MLERNIRTIEDAAIPWLHLAAESSNFASLEEGRLLGAVDVGRGCGKLRTRLHFVGWYLSSTPSSSVMTVMSEYP